MTTLLVSTTAAPVEPEPAATGPTGAEADWAGLAQSVVYIEAAECPSFGVDLYSSGSGTLVLDGTHVLTNAHVVLDDGGRPCQEVTIWFTDSFETEPSRWARADLVAADKQLDLAVLRLGQPASSDKSIEVTAQQLEPGEAIRVLGYPGAGGLTMTLTRGAYSGMVRHEGQTYLKTDAAMGEGNSGGAAFDELGILIGIPTAGVEEVGLLIPAAVAEEFLVEALR